MYSPRARVTHAPIASWLYPAAVIAPARSRTRRTNSHAPFRDAVRLPATGGVLSVTNDAGILRGVPKSGRDSDPAAAASPHQHRPLFTPAVRRAARPGLALGFFDIDGIIDGIFLMPLIAVLRRTIHLLVVIKKTSAARNARRV